MFLSSVRVGAVGVLLIMPPFHAGSFEAVWAKRTGPLCPEVLEGVVRLGVPGELRAEVWAELLEVDLPPCTFDLLVQQGVGALDPEVRGQIDTDVQRMFTKDCPLDYISKVSVPCLTLVLQCLALYDPEVGYCQGLNFTVGMLAYVLGPCPRLMFSAAVGLLTRLSMRSYYTPGLRGLRGDLAAVGVLLAEQAPALRRVLLDHGLDLSQCCTRWLLTLFSGCWAQLDLPWCLRLWDVALATGGGVVLHLTVHLLRAMQLPCLGAGEDLLEVFHLEQGRVMCTEHMLEGVIAKATMPSTLARTREIRAREFHKVVQRSRQQHLVESQVRRGGRVNLTTVSALH